ncbi:MAG: ATP-binding protein, partial [Cyanobacteria bacterium P01_A01_bin.83]
TVKRQANVKNTIEQALNLLSNQMSSGIQVIKHYGNVSTLNCYPEALQKVWFHLLQNAIDAIGNHGILTINLYQQEQMIMVDIIDTGESIKPEITNKLCDPFFTTKSSPDKVGLGLAIAKQIVIQHNGSIAVYLLSGKMTLPGNTKFTVSLPISYEK